MKSGIYRLIICEKIDKNGIAVNSIEFDKIDLTELESLKLATFQENWTVYCQGEYTVKQLQRI